jgi:hypothetical protein
MCRHLPMAGNAYFIKSKIFREETGLGTIEPLTS